MQIDLHVKKLVESLIDRKIVPLKWQEQIRAIKESVMINFDNLPLEAKQLVESKENIHYFECKAVARFLENSDEGQARNFFGQYTSPLLKAWLAIVSTYEKNNVYAAEIARFLQQNALFDIPALKKSILKNEKHIADNNRKIAEHTKSIAEAKRKLAQSCADLRISGQDFRLELQALVYELPFLFRDIATLLCDDALAEVCRYHDDLQQYLFSSVPEGNKPRFEALDALRNSSFDSSPVEQVVNAINFEEAVEIKWEDETTSPNPGDDSGIDWGITESTDIEWDISTTNAPVHCAPSSSGPSTKVELLLESQFRIRITNELIELRAFLAQRKLELKSDDVAFANQFQICGPLLSQQSIKTIDKYISSVDSAIVLLLSDKRLQQLLLIKSSPRYLDRLVTQLEMQRLRSEKLTTQIRSLEDKNADLQATNAATHPQIKELVAKAKELQAQLETALSPLFKGNKVSIIGEINLL
ncbi:hypothetical protein Ae201684P_010159 [Aphanomyces euteiches]|nr:hypothetical protein Ae201684P_010159 [Aphanomyces euteiches]KAH9156827.1 hypothetical protein AeRB84_001278 [Aphanomyces euteiches]